MHIPHFTKQAALRQNLEFVSKTLTENLHLRWSYSVFHVDEYRDDTNRVVCVVFGTHQLQDMLMVFMIRLTETKAGYTEVHIECGRNDTSGYPAKELTQRFVSTQQHQKYAEDTMAQLLEFCQTPHGEGTGMMDIVRSLLNTILGATKSKRKYQA